MIKTEEKKDLYQSLSMDTIIESCLILMVLLLLTCPPPYCRLYSIEITHISGHRFQQRPLGGALSAKLFSTLPPHSPPSLFLNCLPSVTRSVTSPVISSLCLQVVAFCAETRQPGGSLSPHPSPYKKKTNKKKTLQWGGEMGRENPRRSPFGCFLTFSLPLRLPVRRAASIRSSIRLTSIHQLTIVTIRTGIINLDYLKKRWL